MQSSKLFSSLTGLVLLAVSANAQVAVDELVGYGASATGGGSASPVTVTSCDALETALEAGGVVQISGTISDCGVLDVESDTTIIGTGSDSTITGGGLRIKDADNVIVRNIVFHTPSEGDDLLALDGATNVWIDHNSFSSEGLVGSKDTYDGLLDITHASDFVTVSWNTFSDHWKGSLIGHSDSNADEDTGHLRVTYHHNLWTNVNSRTPSLRFGTGHIYNSVYRDIPTSGINSRMGAQVLVESNVFDNVALAIVTDLDSDEEGFAVERDNVFTDSPTEITQVGTFESVDYDYTLDDVASIESILEASAGVGVIA